PQQLAAKNGAKSWAAIYEAFGKATATVSTVTNNLRFPGQYADGETGLNYNYQRTYVPATGRYTQSDPIGLNGGINTFAYVAGNPLRYWDEVGLLVGTGSVGGGFRAQFGAFGGSVNSGRIYGTDGKSCSYITLCFRIGFGFLVAADAGFSGGVNAGGTNNAGGWTFGAGYDVSYGEGTGGNIGVSVGGVGRGIFSRNMGLGISGGADVCYTEVFNCDCSGN
ncbi:MAG: RHS repeat-associated core domain-containing protein, partial [Deltaproteobacteria bacterium]